MKKPLADGPPRSAEEHMRRNFAHNDLGEERVQARGTGGCGGEYEKDITQIHRSMGYTFRHINIYLCMIYLYIHHV